MDPLTYADIKEPFLRALNLDRRASYLIREIEAGRGTYEMASEYAARVGDTLAKVLRRHAPLESIEEWDIDTLIPQSLGLNHSIISYACEQVQNEMNANARLGIRFQAPQFDSDRAFGIVQELRDNPEFTNIEATFYDQLANFSQNVVDEAIRDNAAIMERAGIRSKIIRTPEAGACSWCDDVAGTYDYDEVRNGGDVWRRHENCRCTINFVTERNSGIFSQEVNNFRR